MDGESPAAAAGSLEAVNEAQPAAASAPSLFAKLPPATEDIVPKTAQKPSEASEQLRGQQPSQDGEEAAGEVDDDGSTGGTVDKRGKGKKGKSRTTGGEDQGATEASDAEGSDDDDDDYHNSKCSKCRKENVSEEDPFLLCEDCPRIYHLKCTELTKLPPEEESW